MPSKAFLGELEQMILLAILKYENAATAIEVSGELEASARRTVARGALYTTLQRLERKGLLEWRVDPGGDERANLPKRRFTVRAAGIQALRVSLDALRRLSAGSEHVLDTSR